MIKPEILAPAGSFEALTAAVRSGADAVYFGTGNFNARRNASNFSGDDLQRAVDFCHERNVKVHITLNTLVKDSEMSELKESVRRICKSGADALILQDIGVLRVVKDICPDIELHASTQMSVGTLDGIRTLADLGFSRAVLPRELSKDEIKYLCENSPIELEMFVHGALCMCVSGQCLLSAFLGSRSGNRGLCAQPCRLPFTAENGTGHDLSLKDLSLIEYAPILSKTGISSFKIEGRMKRPEYVAAAVFQYAVVDDTGAENLDPTGVLAQRAALAAALEAGNVDFDARLGEREVRRTQAGLDVCTEQRLDEFVEHSLQVAERDALVNDEAFHLVEHRGVGRVGVGTEHAARDQHLDRRLFHVHDADLTAAGLGSQHNVVCDVERILHVAGGMVLRHIQAGKVVVVVLDLRALVNLKAHTGEHVDDLILDEGDRV